MRDQSASFGIDTKLEAVASNSQLLAMKETVPIYRWQQYSTSRLDVWIPSLPLRVLYRTHYSRASGSSNLVATSLSYSILCASGIELGASPTFFSRAIIAHENVVQDRSRSSVSITLFHHGALRPYH